jgi:succinate-acetate transporter protein
MPTSNEAYEVTPARIYLQPVAAPSILGLFALAGATFMVSAHFAGWYGGPATIFFLAPFIAIFGGLAQFLAGMWAYKARDGMATALHGLWGSFWIAFGLLALGFARAGVGMVATTFPALGYWFIVVGAITWVLAWAALAENVSLFVTLLFYGGGCTLVAISLLSGAVGALMIAAAYCFLIGSLVAFYTATAMMLAEAFGRTVLNFGRRPRGERIRGISVGEGEPGVIRGQKLDLAPQH